MNRLTKLISTVLVILTCAAWSQRDQACGNCEITEQTLNKVMETQKAFNQSQADMKKNHVVMGPTDERMAFELAQGEAYRLVCDDGKKSLNPIEKKALMHFVFAMNSLDIESDALHDLNGCFFRKVMHNKSGYVTAANDLGVRAELDDFLKRNQPQYQDER